MDMQSWYPPPTPRVTSVDVQPPLAAPWTGAPLDQWNECLARPEPVGVFAVQTCTPRPRAVSVPIGRPAVRVRSFTFDEPDMPAAAPPGNAAPNAPVPVDRVLASMPATTRLTRIRPPGDVIKLADRLHYLLQPPLESLLTERSLTFPFHPFPYQFEGVAFMYSRHAAVLADEMGLGKTMQTITAVRLLLRCGELKTVLLICPKPLVTNWQR